MWEEGSSLPAAGLGVPGAWTVLLRLLSEAGLKECVLDRMAKYAPAILNDIRRFF